MQRFPNEANLKQQRVKFVQVKGVHFVEPFEHFVVCSSHFSPDCDEKSYMVEMGLRMKTQLLPSAISMIQALLKANDSEVKKRPIQSADGEDSEVADRDHTRKQPRRS